jgi:TPR repeat protein
MRSKRQSGKFRFAGPSILTLYFVCLAICAQAQETAIQPQEVLSKYEDARTLRRTDPKKAGVLLIEAAEGNVIEAQLELAGAYITGEYGLLKDSEAAAKWYSRAATAGNPEAQYRLALCYSLGEGVEKNLALKISWLKQAAKLGHTKSQTMLGKALMFGDGVKLDYVEAIVWLRQAADKDEWEAQRYLALCYENGLGVPKDSAEGGRWSAKSEKNRLK